MSAQKRAAYTCRQRTKRWHMSLLFFAVDIACINAHILECLLANHAKFHDQLAFRMRLVAELLAAGGFPDLHRPPRWSAQNVPAPPASATPRFAHLPEFSDKKNRCFHCVSIGKSRPGWSHFTCGQCRRHFCLSSRRNCFADYHVTCTF